MSVPGKGRMDHSPGELEGEIDFTHRDMAIDYLLMPERVKKLEGQLEAVNCDLEKINGNLQKLADVLGKICDFENAGQVPSSGEGGKQQYVTSAFRT